MNLARPVVEVVNLGRMGYTEALLAQRRYVQRHLDTLFQPSHTANTLLLCEHPPVFTVGIRRAPYPAQDEERLRALGAEFHRTDRGGLITFHGPGQLVCYPVLDLRGFRKSLRWYVGELEATAMQVCHMFGISAETSADTGVWVGDNKICAIGIHCGRYITSHGLALNCNVDLGWFSHITPCGITGKGVTSLSRELGRAVSVTEAVPPLLQAFAERFNCTLVAMETTAHVT
ncbi:putative lipoyltransferase 2, mitochondrial [Callorhinchus milii]|uniref:Octanoyl-[acyl-carrier-protein]:protein N-octanoyltransferase LIPT2, mitochondrial n=1 Tax=Callorhinchus milii TaxID=7868 RepID=A0A4W3JBM2_CALMI|nr:putative lipoyltransferase 2, mitochondrial [Callorhinchus milii]XP_042190479.1 putative lipoyltransferase 2, mitochondrial [Callorhinchus milii]|eukprot:gi/632985379/ref/XP_007909649.1/ PREDICTED: putative lipoyltransferase 2, mitochondrial [Callorhinchus milii]